MHTAFSMHTAFKVFEKIMYDQLYEYIEHFLNQLLVWISESTFDTTFLDFYKNGKKSLTQEGFLVQL